MPPHGKQYEISTSILGMISVLGLFYVVFLLQELFTFMVIEAKTPNVC